MRRSKPTLALSSIRKEEDKFMTKCFHNTRSTKMSLVATLLVVLSCHGAENEPTGPSIKDAFASVQRDGRPYHADA